MASSNSQDFKGPTFTTVRFGFVLATSACLIATVPANIPVVKQFDWPNPRQPSGFYLGLKTLGRDSAKTSPFPFNQYNWSVPPTPARSAVGFTLPALTFATFVNTPGVTSRYWTLPPLRVAGPNVGFVQGFNVYGLTFTPRTGPFNLVDTTVLPPRAAKSVDGFIGRPLTFASFVNTVPFVQRDWPNPRAAARSSQDWALALPRVIAAVINTPPVSARYWANPQLPKTNLYASIDSVAIDTGSVAAVTPVAARYWTNPSLGALRSHVGFVRSSPMAIPVSVFGAFSAVGTGVANFTSSDTAFTAFTMAGTGTATFDSLNRAVFSMVGTSIATFTTDNFNLIDVAGQERPTPTNLIDVADQELPTTANLIDDPDWP